MLVGLIPAAGHARRLGGQPTSKEVIPVRGRPVIDHLIERMHVASPDQLRIVTRPEKRDVVTHASRIGARVIPGHPADVAASLQLGLADLDDADEVLIGFPDSLWEPRDGYLPLLAAIRNGAPAALGLFSTDEPERSDVVVCDDHGRVIRVDVKPGAPSTDVIWGIAAARVRALRDLDEGTEPGAHFGALAANGDVRGIWLSSEWLDIGTPETLERVKDA